MPEPIISIQNLTKRYGSRTAVEDLDLQVFPGDIFGFVGPNGAGKTSTIRIMATLLQPTAGEIRIAGHSVRFEPRQVRQVIGYMPDFFGVYNDMRVWEYLDFFAACYAIPPAQRPALIGDLLELVELSHRHDDMVDSLSRGMKQRLSLARTLVHDPQVLILDEPASGLDPRARVEIRALLVELANMGKTIFFSTHILSDVAEICTRIGIIEAGQLVAAGDLETLQQQWVPRRQVEITLLDSVDGAESQRGRQLLLAQPGVETVQVQENGNATPAINVLTAEAPDDEGAAARPLRRRLLVEFSGDDAALSAVLSSLVTAGLPVLHFREDNRDLEQVFMQVTKGLVS